MRYPRYGIQVIAFFISLIYFFVLPITHQLFDLISLLKCKFLPLYWFILLRTSPRVWYNSRTNESNILLSRFFNPSKSHYDEVVLVSLPTIFAYKSSLCKFKYFYWPLESLGIWIFTLISLFILFSHTNPTKKKKESIIFLLTHGRNICSLPGDQEWP